MLHPQQCSRSLNLTSRLRVVDIEPRLTERATRCREDNGRTEDRTGRARRSTSSSRPRSRSRLRCLQRAVGTYKAAAQVSVKPDIDTRNLLLEDCIFVHHHELSDRLLMDVNGAGIKPDVTTYWRMVRLCVTQTNDIQGRVPLPRGDEGAPDGPAA